MAVRSWNYHGTIEYYVDAEADLATIPNPKLGEVALALAEGSLWFHTGTVWQEIGGGGGISGATISRGGTLYASGGLSTGASLIVWRAPFAATVTNVRGFRVGGTGATVNGRRNQTDTFLSSDLSLTSTDQWLDGGAVQNTALVAGDEMEIQVVTVAGTPSQVAVQVDLTRT